MSALTNAERQRRHRERQRAERDPVVRYCRSVIEWDGRVQSPASGRLALIAVDVIDRARHRATGPKTTYEILTGLPLPGGSSREAPTEAERVALAALGRAQAEMEADVAPDRRVPVSEVSIRAGLHHAKRLTVMPSNRANAEASLIAMARLLAAGAGNPPPHLIGPAGDHDDDATPDALRDLTDGDASDLSERDE